ncbi:MULTISPECIES: 2TM domain-containing protein [unclassified Chryseobacterium]|uniref:2TM domain-containing protein n=1 Tax=unclassified Chryseobacterium TaxID=2593645 RepID=UPI0028535FA5|nr:2TM domain-containing protein [Chryseobacterium sp. CFS7]MDR4891712.1 2TM domain-containing protein [Chryseobacterium sp. CFS7]
MGTFDENDIEYQRARRQVERLRGFYGHLFAYIAVNAMIVVYNYTNLKPGESYFQFKNFFTATFWGIGLAAHAVTVFLPRVNFIRKWEDKKIKELMDKQKDH